MKNWFSNLTKDTTPKARMAFYTALLFIVSALLSLPLNLYAYSQTGAWQIVFSTIGLAILCIVSGYAAQVARRNQHQRAALVLIGIASLFIPFISSLIAGLGMVLGLSLFLINAAIAGQNLEGRPAFISLITALLFSLLAIFIDLFAYWERITVPVLTNFIPVIAIAIVIVLGIITIRQFRTYSLRTKLLAIILGIAIVSVSTVAFVTNLTLTYQLNLASESRLTAVSETTANEIASILIQDKDLLNILALNKFIQDGVEEANFVGTSDLNQLNELDQRWVNANDNNPLIQNVLDNELASELIEFQGSYPLFSEIFLTDQYGAIISSTNRTSDYYQADEEWWVSAWNNGSGGFYISEPFYDESAGVDAIQMAIPIPGHGRKDIVGVIRATINIAELGEILVRNEADLLFANNQYIANEEFSEIISLEDEEVAILSSQTVEGFEEVIWDDTLSFLRIASLSSEDETINNLGWVVIVNQEVSEARAPIANASRIIFLATIVLLIASVILAFYIGNLFVRPIESLTATANRLAAGDLSAKADVESLDELGLLSTTFNEMSKQIRDLISTLEQRVTDRTKALSASTEVSRRLSTILDERQLVKEVVEQVQNAFDYYHVHIYLMDNKQEKLIMAGGTGEAGKTMLVKGHSIPVGKGLVGRAGETNTPILVSDTANNPDWLPNPLLPDTRAEIAVPISISDQVLGVLDVQQNIVDGLKREDVDLLQSIANQAAIALQNARTLVSAQDRASREQLISSINQKIQNETTVESALQVAVREVGRALGVQTSVRLKTMGNKISQDRNPSKEII